jgi:hypothetical protein
MDRADGALRMGSSRHAKKAGDSDAPAEQSAQNY